MNWIEELLFGKKMSHQSDNDYEASRVVSLGCWASIVIVAFVVIRFVIWTLSINW